jgi:hypothetical protein
MKLTEEEIAWIKRHAYRPQKFIAAYEKIAAGDLLTKNEVALGLYLRKRSAALALAPLGEPELRCHPPDLRIPLTSPGLAVSYDRPDRHVREPTDNATKPAPRPLTGMDTDVLEHRLVLLERQIADAERHLTLRRDILTRLELDSLGASETADITRDRLRWTEERLRVHTAERKRLQAQLRRAGLRAR